MRENPVYLTLRRAAEALGVHEQTLRAWEKRGLIRMARLPGSRYRRVPVEEVERLKSEMISASPAAAVSAQTPTVHEPPAAYHARMEQSAVVQSAGASIHKDRSTAVLLTPEEYQGFQAWLRFQSRCEEQLAHLQAERAAFQRLLPELLATHAGQFVAIHNGRVSDSDANEGELAWRMIGRGLKPVYIGEVRSGHRVYDLPALEVITHVSL